MFGGEKIEQLISTHGYIILLAGTFLEGETVLIIAGFLAHRGYLELPWVIVVAFIGTLAGDQLYFFMGREKGLKYLTKRPTWQAKAERVFEFLRNHELWILTRISLFIWISHRHAISHRCNRLFPAEIHRLKFHRGCGLGSGGRFPRVSLGLHA